MEPLVTLDTVSLAFGLAPLLEQATFQIHRGERVCLIGRNGAGKSSLLKIIEGTLLPDSGTVWRQPTLRLARLQQELPQSSSQTVFEFVAEGLATAGQLLTAWTAATQRLAGPHTPADLARLESLQHEMDAANAWHFEREIKTILTRLELSPEVKVAALSGGWQRRAALARALVSSPDLLLLDEPTNHLDIEAIQWLEQTLLENCPALIFITHDRALLQRLATRIVELDRGQLTSWPGDYAKFLQRKAERLLAEAKQHADFDKKLATEEKWIRQGIKARRTRNEGRVRALEAMRQERSRRREVEGKANFSLSLGEKSGQLVLEAKNLSHQYDGVEVIKDFSLRVMRGDRIGLIGPNGSGKSTLLNLLLGKMPPQQGTVTQGTKLEVAYFDQRLTALDPDRSVAENVSQGGEFIDHEGQKCHVIGYLGNFLFTPQRALSPVRQLSGGECNRLLLARLFSRPSNVLVMDEPTNDLDIETLELLEDILSRYKGTLLLVSHDRQFLDNVVTSTLVFSGNGRIKEYIGGYQDWLQQRQLPVESPTPKVTREKPKPVRTKLSFKEQTELAGLPLKIEELESSLAAQQAWLADPACHRQGQAAVTEASEKLHALQIALEEAWQRWDALEGRSKGGAGQ